MPVSDGHTCIKAEKSDEMTSGDFRLLMSYNILSERDAEYVIHVWTNIGDYSPYMQRYDLLQRLGFQAAVLCSFTDYKCYYYVLARVDRDRVREDLFYRDQFFKRFKAFGGNLQKIFEAMRGLDVLLQEGGVALPYSGLRLAEIRVTDEVKERAYQPGEQYDLWKDLKRFLVAARKEVFVIEPYPDETIFELYLDEVPQNVPATKVLVNKPRGKFLSVANIFSKKRPLDVRQSPNFHDRHLFIDDRGWVIGSSIKDAAAKKPTYMIEIVGVDTYRNIYDTMFKNARKLI